MTFPTGGKPDQKFFWTGAKYQEILQEHKCQKTVIERCHKAMKKPECYEKRVNVRTGRYQDGKTVWIGHCKTDNFVRNTVTQADIDRERARGVVAFKPNPWRPRRGGRRRRR